jgi:hypothetical protein
VAVSKSTTTPQIAAHQSPIEKFHAFIYYTQAPTGFTGRRFDCIKHNHIKSIFRVSDEEDGQGGHCIGERYAISRKSVLSNRYKYTWRITSATALRHNHEHESAIMVIMNHKGMRARFKKALSAKRAVRLSLEELLLRRA